jgi:hypothetical protein
MCLHQLFILNSLSTIKYKEVSFCLTILKSKLTLSRAICKVSGNVKK